MKPDLLKFDVLDGHDSGELHCPATALMVIGQRVL